MKKLRSSELKTEPEFTREILGGDDADGSARHGWGLKFTETAGLHCEAAV